MVNGTLVWYYTICKRELWLMGHGIAPDQKNNRIAIGRHIHSLYFSRVKLREVMVDGKIKIDLIKGKNIIVEIKKSSKFIESTKWQLLFYLYYLKKNKGVEMEGEISIPEEKRSIRIQLSDSDIEKIEEMVRDIERIISMDKPPKAEWIKYCKVCGYKEMCWV